MDEYFLKVKPRKIRLDVKLPPVVILTDAAAEECGASLGAVLIDTYTGCYEFFGKRISANMVAQWQALGRNQVICQAELITIPLALATWRGRLADRDVFVFIDNDPARECLIRGLSSASDSTRYVHACRLLCAENGMAAWYARVASPSNIADQPSRGDFSVLLASGAKCVEPVSLACEPHLVLHNF